MKRALVILLLMCATACTHKDPPEKVKIVAVDAYHTTIEFPDGTRMRQWGVYGKVGDEFTARRVHDSFNGDSLE